MAQELFCPHCTERVAFVKNTDDPPVMFVYCSTCPMVSEVDRHGDLTDYPGVTLRDLHSTLDLLEHELFIDSPWTSALQHLGASHES